LQHDDDYTEQLLSKAFFHLFLGRKDNFFFQTKECFFYFFTNNSAKSKGD